MSGAFGPCSAYYDLIYRNKDYAAEASYVRSLLTRHGARGRELLELGCGTGRHAAYLARDGYRVHGIDLSPEMVGLARASIPCELAERLRFDTGDVRNVRLGSQFDAVLALFHVASYQTTNQDLTAMFATAAVHLQPGGLFIFDFWYGPGVLSEPPAVRVKRLQDRQVEVTRIAEPAQLADQNIVDVRYTYFVKDRATSVITQLEETQRMRYLFLPELEPMLRHAGLRMVVAERWMSGELDAGSWQAVVVARKN